MIALDRKQLSVHLGYYVDEAGPNQVLEDLTRRVTALSNVGARYNADPQHVAQAQRIAAKLRAIVSELRP